MWFKAFYWMRLFKPTAFFMNLLASTFVDIAEFIIMMVILIFAAANLFYIFNSSRASPYTDGNRIFDEDLESMDLFNAVIHSYKLSLGDFATESYQGNGDMSLWLLFLAATVLL